MLRSRRSHPAAVGPAAVGPTPDGEDANRIALNRTINCMFPAQAVSCFPC
jgi:hypothetical protein